MRVLVIANNLSQPSYRVRIEALLEPLRRSGVEWIVQVRPRTLHERRALLKSAVGYDAVILQRKLLDPDDARSLRKSARRVFFDVDDAVMHHAHPVGLFSRWRTARRFAATAANVDHVVAGNAYLADLFRKAGAPAASMLPTTVNAARYPVKSHAMTHTPRLVWIGSRSTLPYLREIVPQIAEAARRVPGLGLVTIADATLDDVPFAVEHVPWSAEGETAALLGGDIGIAPTPDDRWTRGKCGFKLIQYMAAGLPTIASPIGANAEIVQDGETGFMPATAKDWPGVIERLARDVELRTRLGAAGRQRVEAHYTTERAADRWLELLGRQQ